MRKNRVFERHGLLWIDVTLADGRRIRRSTGLEPGKEVAAQAILAQVKVTAEAGADKVDPVSGEVTVASYARHWLEARKKRGVSFVGSESSLFKHHVFGTPLAAMRLAEVRPTQIRGYVHVIKNKESQRGGVLSPRTVRHIYSALRTLFQDAVVEELMLANPCVLRRGDLPPKADSRNFDRQAAVFERAEVEALISDERIPEDRRTLYALMQLTGMRPGEAAALQWRDWDRDLKPLGRLRVAKSYDPRKKLVKGTKTGVSRNVPVHPTLAKVLAAWKLEGWQRAFGSVPSGENLIVPNREGGHRGSKLLRQFHGDLANLGMRPRRNYDSRRTFISLGQAAGASKDILRWVTHGSAQDIVDQYTTIPWPALCEHVAKLPVDLREGRVLELRQVGGTGVEAPISEGGARWAREILVPMTVSSPDLSASPAKPRLDASECAKVLVMKGDLGASIPIAPTPFRSPCQNAGAAGPYP